MTQQKREEYKINTLSVTPPEFALSIIILILPFIIVGLIIHKITSGKDQPTIRKKKEAMHYIHYSIYKDNNEDLKIIRHQIKTPEDHEVIIKRPDGYYEILLKKVDGYADYFYKIQPLNKKENKSNDFK